MGCLAKCCVDAVCTLGYRSEMWIVTSSRTRSATREYILGRFAPDTAVKSGIRAALDEADA